MKALREGFAFYIFGNIHVALSVLCLLRLTMLEYGIQDDGQALFIFFATIFAYNLIRFFQLYKINSSVASWIRQHGKSLIVLNLFSLLAMTVLATTLKIRDIGFLLPFALMTLFYVVPLTHHFKGLRYVAGLKLFLIAFTWAGITVVYPLYSKGVPFSQPIGIEFVQRFLFIVAITIPFDIRDTEFDLPELATLPQVVGIKNAKALALICLVLFVSLDYWKPAMSGVDLIIDLLVAILSGFLIVGTQQKQSRYYTGFWIESMPVLWFLLRWIFSS